MIAQTLTFGVLLLIMWTIVILLVWNDAKSVKKEKGKPTMNNEVEATEVVKCKDCFYWMKAKVNRQGDLVCPKSGMVITATDYCSKAEKRMCHYDR